MELITVLKILFFCFFTCFGLNANSEVTRSPLVLFPGYFGSQLWGEYKTQPSKWYCRRHGQFTIWINPLNFLHGQSNCMIDSMTLDYDPATKTTRNHLDIDITVPGFGSTKYVEYLSPIRLFHLKQTSEFYDLVEHLVKEMGYTRDFDIVGAPYDFRKKPDELTEYFQNVKKLIEKLYHQNGAETPVTLLAHSMGNIIVLHFLQKMPQPWKDKYINKFISTSPPYGGSVGAISNALSGYNEDISLITDLQMRRMESSWPSTYVMFPNRDGGAFSPDDVFVMTDKRNYTMNDFEALLRDSKLKNAVNLYKDTLHAIDWPRAPNVTVECIWSVGKKTASQLDYRGLKFPDGPPKVLPRDGDGSVPTNSNSLCYKWKSLQNKPVSRHIIKNRGHLDILRHSDYSDIVKKLVKL